jgi:feruloyl-CoA synthase
MPVPDYRSTWDALEELALETVGERIVITTGLGSTETAPSALFATGLADRGLLGTPVPGLELKLVPNEDKLEARYRGPNIMPGYWRQPGTTQTSFDEEGFYLTGDALKLVDADRPERGMVFDGRIAEDFKLLTGTWVSVGNLRAAVIAGGSSLIQDVVIAGHDRDHLAAILFPKLDACRALCPDLPANAHVDFVVAHPRGERRCKRFSTSSQLQHRQRDTHRARAAGGDSSSIDAGKSLTRARSTNAPCCATGSARG